MPKGVPRTKRCARCGRAQSRKAFNKNVRTPDGFANVCKACAGAAIKKGRKKAGRGATRIAAANAQLQKAALGVMEVPFSEVAAMGLIPEIASLHKRMIAGGIVRMDLDAKTNTITIVRRGNDGQENE